MFRTAILIAAIAVGLVLAGSVWVVDDDYCRRTELVPQSTPEGALVDTEWLLFPPGIQCSYIHPDGNTVVEGPGISGFVRLVLAVALPAAAMKWKRTQQRKRSRLEDGA